MADNKSRDVNQQRDQGNEKAKGAAATAGVQGQPERGQPLPPDAESSGQGGGIQGTGQRQPSQGQRDQGGKNQQGSLRDQSSRKGGQGSQTDDDDF